MNNTNIISGDINTGTFWAVMAGMFVFILVFIAAIYVFTAVFTSMIFKKAGVPTWKAWVPFLNNWKFFEIGGQTGALSLLSLIPWVGGVISMVFMCIAAYNIGLKLGKTGTWVVMYIFLSPVWLVIMGISKEPWNEGVGTPSKAVETAAMYAAYYGDQSQQPAEPEVTQ
ncbi:DUF5684 domain-containing protein [Candidatus Saccharibacteria bacterium]|nr:DUF5684 domain-containing protein [Candidatus Saccharibacteria bacterium]